MFRSPVRPTGKNGSKKKKCFPAGTLYYSRGEAKGGQGHEHRTFACGEASADADGQIVGISTDGSRITLECRPCGKPSWKTEIRLTNRTRCTYSRIGPGGGRPVVGYQARAWLEQGSRDALRVQYRAPSRDGRRYLSGKVLAVSQDNRCVTLELAARDARGQVQKVEVKIGHRTQTTFHGVGPGGARPAVGHRARVWLREGWKNTAAELRFTAGQS